MATDDTYPVVSAPFVTFVVLPLPLYVADELEDELVRVVREEEELPFPVALPTMSFAPNTVVVHPKIKMAAQRIVTSFAIRFLLFIVFSPLFPYLRSPQTDTSKWQLPQLSIYVTNYSISVHICKATI